MHRKLVLLGMVLATLLCSCLVVSADASSGWSKTYGGASYDVAFSLVATSDGGYAITGYTESFGVVGMAIWLVKIDALGNMQWNRTYGETGLDTARALVVTSDGGYAIAGTWNDTGPFGNRGDFWLVKTDSNGVMQWNRTYGRSGKSEAYSLVATSDGGYAITGTDFWLVKTDASGNMQWNKTYEGPGYEVARALVATSDGGYAIAGYTTSFGSGGNDFWLVKTDAAGNAEWNQTYGGTDGESAYALVATSDGGYAIAGDNSQSIEQSRFWLVKTNASGFMQWNQTYVKGGAYSLVATSDGGYALGGYALDVGSLLVKTDAIGTVMWNRTYSEGNVLSLVAASDGGYALAGDVESSEDADFWVLKTNENGFVPEYSSLLVPALVLTATAFIIINKKKLLRAR